MLNQSEIMQTIQMIDQQHLDVRTITMGISLLSCAHSDVKTACDKVYDKITRYAEHLVATGQAIEKEFGIPIVNKRVSVTSEPIWIGINSKRSGASCWNRLRKPRWDSPIGAGSSPAPSCSPIRTGPPGSTW